MKTPFPSQVDMQYQTGQDSVEYFRLHFFTLFCLDFLFIGFFFSVAIVLDCGIVLLAVVSLGCARALTLCIPCAIVSDMLLGYSLFELRFDQFTDCCSCTNESIRCKCPSVSPSAPFSSCCRRHCALGPPTRCLTVWPDVWRSCRAGAGQGRQPRRCGILIWAICNDRPPLSAEEWQVERL